ncbi:hypothetical protein ACSBR2_034422 [Camellia fascicularis]
MATFTGTPQQQPCHYTWRRRNPSNTIVDHCLNTLENTNVHLKVWRISINKRVAGTYSGYLLVEKISFTCMFVLGLSRRWAANVN